MWAWTLCGLERPRQASFPVGLAVSGFGPSPRGSGHRLLPECLFVVLLLTSFHNNVGTRLWPSLPVSSSLRPRPFQK